MYTITNFKTKKALKEAVAAYERFVSDRLKIVVRLHNTNIVVFHDDGRVTLHTGGYRTVTTKSRMNQFIRANVYQRARQWYVCLTDGVEVIFSEGIEVSA